MYRKFVFFFKYVFFIFRVKFRHDVEIKEFIRSDYEMEDTYLSNDNQETNVLTMGMTCLICVTFTVLLPWYILIGTN